MNDFLLAIAIISQLTGLTLPQVLEENFYILPTYTKDNTQQLEAEEIIENLPVVKKQSGPQPVDNFVAAPNNLQAKAAIAVDAATGQVLYQKNQEAQLSIASLTKLMTSLVFLDHNPGWDHKYKMRADENYLIGAKLKIGNNQELSTHDLLRTTLVGSANNTAKALARSTGLSDQQFVAAMNEKAQFLGLQHSNFVEPTGLEAGNMSSALDLSIIVREVMKHQPLLDAMILTEHALEIPPDNHRHIVKSTDKLLQDNEVNVIAGKTGFTYEADYCLATLSKNEQGHNIIVVTLGLPTESVRDSENKKLIKWTFNNYLWD